MTAINSLLAKDILPDAMIRMGIRHRLAEAQRAALLEYVAG